jgi:hypothetical protein
MIRKLEFGSEALGEKAGITYGPNELFGLLDIKRELNDLKVRTVDFQTQLISQVPKTVVHGSWTKLLPCSPNMKKYPMTDTEKQMILELEEATREGILTKSRYCAGKRK